MTDRVYFLTKNYRVQCEKFKALLEHVRKICATQDDADKLMKLHHVFYRHNPDFKHNIENHGKTMWLFSNNKDIRKMSVHKLVETSKQNKIPVTSFLLV